MGATPLVQSLGYISAYMLCMVLSRSNLVANLFVLFFWLIICRENGLGRTTLQLALFVEIRAGHPRSLWDRGRRGRGSRERVPGSRHVRTVSVLWICGPFSRQCRVQHVGIMEMMNEANAVHIWNFTALLSFIFVLENLFGHPPF